MLLVDDVTVRFGERAVLDRVSLEVADREIVALLGRSGSGKSTLLRVIAGIIAPDRGRIVLDGVDVTAMPTHRRSIGMVFQDEQLFPHLDVAGNIAFGLRTAGVDKVERRRRVGELLELVGLPGFGSRRIAGLSGGERKRVALARSLAPEPRLLLLDEPLTGLDHELHDRLQLEVTEILRATGTTALWVTHDRSEAAAVATRTVRIESLSAAGRFTVVEIDAAETHDLRRRVLREGTRSDQVVFDGDELESTFHLGARLGDGGDEGGGPLAAIATFIERRYPDRPAEPAFQLRGMATDPSQRGLGLGSQLLAAGIERCAAAGATLLWARARDSALPFYLEHGFSTVGPGYVDLTTGLPHHDILRSIP